MSTALSDEASDWLGSSTTTVRLSPSAFRLALLSSGDCAAWRLAPVTAPGLSSTPLAGSFWWRFSGDPSLSLEGRYHWIGEYHNLLKSSGHQIENKETGAKSKSRLEFPAYRTVFRPTTQ